MLKKLTGAEGEDIWAEETIGVKPQAQERQTSAEDHQRSLGKKRTSEDGERGWNAGDWQRRASGGRGLGEQEDTVLENVVLVKCYMLGICRKSTEARRADSHGENIDSSSKNPKESNGGNNGKKDTRKKSHMTDYGRDKEGNRGIRE